MEDMARSLLAGTQPGDPVLRRRTDTIAMVYFWFVGKALAAILAVGCTPLQSRAEVEFLPAQHDSASGNVLFKWTRQIDWESLARDHASWAFADTLSPERLDQIEKHYCEPCGSSDVPFDAPLDTPPRDGFRYSLITPQGVEPLALTHFAGWVRFDKRADGSWKRDRAFGQGAAALASRGVPRNGGFVLVVAEGVSADRILGGRFVAKRNGEQLEFSYQRDNLHYTLTLPFEGTGDVESTLSFRIGQREFCWIQWKPDRGCEYACCEEQYSLFSVDGELRLLDTHLYDCDL